MTPIDKTVAIAQLKAHSDFYHPHVMVCVLAGCHIFREAAHACQNTPPEQGTTAAHTDHKLAVELGVLRQDDRVRLEPDANATEDRVNITIFHQHIQHGPMPVWAPEIVMVQEGDKLTARGIKSRVARR